MKKSNKGQSCLADEFAKVVSDVDSFVHQAVMETNLGYKNSEIPLELKLFCINPVPGLPEVRNYKDMLFSFIKHFNS